MAENQNTNEKKFNKKKYLLLLLLGSTAFAQMALFQNCGQMKTASNSSVTGQGGAIYFWQLSNWSTCSSPSCAQQTRTATCMSIIDDVTDVETNSSLCGTQSQPLTQPCGATVPECNTSPGTCTNNGAPTCVNGHLMQDRVCTPVGSTCTGGCPAVDTGTCGGGTSSGNLFVTPVAAGTVDITLNPQASVALNQPTNIVFGVPFPKQFINNVANIRVLNSSGTEVPSFVTAMTYWRNFQSPSTIISLKSVQVGITYTFTNRNPVVMRVQWGTQRTQNITSTFTVASTWVPMAASGIYTDEYPTSANVQEPKVYVTLPSSWMSQSLLKTRTTSINEVSNYSWFDTNFLDFSTQAVNQTAYRTTAEPWLYDRAQTLYFAYIRSGSVEWLRHAHRAAQFYKANINTDGSFALGGDSKYVYGQSMLYDMIMTGDTSLGPIIERTRQPHSGWTTNYSINTGFWTERGQGYAMLASLAAFEATGAASDAARVTALFNSVFNMQQNPGNGWTRIGCPLHTHEQHDPDEDIPEVLCSPWMGALIADAVWKYYILSLDNNALIYLADYGDYITNYALVTENNLRLPYYAASYLGNTGEGDIEHTCDVMGALAKSYWAKEALGRSSTAVAASTTALLTSCRENLADGDLSPARKYSWWFGTNSDFGWLLSNLP